MIARAAGLGETWRSFFNPDELANEVPTSDFHGVEDLSPMDVAIRYFGERDPPRPEYTSSTLGAALMSEGVSSVLKTPSSSAMSGYWSVARLQTANC
jgi:hypothetical protein